MLAPILLLLSLLFIPATVQADQTTADIEALLAEVPKGDKPELQRLRDSYGQALQLVREGERYQQQAIELKEFMDSYPAKSKKLEQQLKNFKPTNTAGIANMTEEAAQLALVSAQTRRLKLSQQREELNNALNLLELSDSGLLDLLNDLRQRLLKTQKSLDDMQLDESQGRQQAANRILALAREQALQKRIQAVELEQLSSANRNRMDRLTLELLQKQIADLDSRIEALQGRQNELRRETTEATIAESDRLLGEVMSDAPLLAKQQELNQRLSTQLSDRSRAIEALQQEYQAVEQSAGELATMQANLKEQLEWLQVSRGFGENLRNRLNDLPAPYPLPQLEARIVESRVDKYSFQEALDNLQTNGYSENLRLAQLDPELDAEQLAQLEELLSTQQRLLERLIVATENYIHEQTRLKVAYSRQNNQLAEIKALTDERLFWLPDLRPLDGHFPQALAETLGWLLKAKTWTALPQSLLQQGTANLTLYGLGSLVVLYLWYLSRRSLKDYLADISTRIGKVTLDKYQYTFNTLLLSLLSALPLPALLSLLGNAIDSTWAPPIVAALAHGLRELMAPVFILLVVTNLMRGNGLLVVHFNLPRQKVQRIRRQFQTLMLMLLPALLLFYVSQEFREYSLYDTQGRLSFMFGCVLISLFSWRMYREGLPLLITTPKREHLTYVNHLLWAVLIISPLAAMVAAMMGYLFTAYTLLRQLEVSVLVGVSFLLFYYLVSRWMLLQRRRLAFERAKSKRAEMLAQRGKERVKQKEEGAEPQASSEMEMTEEPEVDLNTISSQSLGLLRSALMFGYVLGLMLLWSELNTAFSFLDTIEVWQVSSTLAGEDSLVPISLKDLVIAVFVVVLTLVTARNLPGLMELSLLQRLDLSPGTGFAITTISKYVVLIVGSFTTFAMLGIDWSKTQWLVAALSVGLGFGLQEIFANFVSGLIILFEKPIRIGDTVTIRELTGTISKIKTRATTIVDWDRREIIVPNKAFITEQFINWSLSDAITRVKLLIRVRLDADIELVQALTHEAIGECSLILDSPIPEVFLVEMTDSALVYEVRVYVNDMSHRMPMTHELHNLLLERLRRYDIKIPHQQIDIRLIGEQPIRTIDAGRG
ncbi:miniconductance mechanosensitive channel MscM [Zobellella maritima]|uniref:miniconductance mechanosensitive channel MscM n=1 Tax=Zobellella maritima TaxID=2059725 RepID=UPI000E302B25|nr:miniconductance mechanosensitive channel MscM [Zobellella maritima]